MYCIIFFNMGLKQTVSQVVDQMVPYLFAEQEPWLKVQVALL